MKNIEAIDLKSWDTPISPEIQKKAIDALESGKVVLFPNLAFPLSENELKLLSPDKTDPKSKNISYDLRSQKLGGAQCSEIEKTQLAAMIKRYAISSRNMLEKLFPIYAGHFEQARTSFRPVEIEGRKSSYRKDDTLLHVDAFPSSPVQGKRIMRFFTNINHEGKPRVWRVGEPFQNVVAKIGPRTSQPFPGKAELYNMLGITKAYRTLYDHYMLQLHDTMKGDMKYQKEVPQEEVRFVPGNTWIVYTDQVSHAAMSGQHLLEQSFYLPPNAMARPETTPLAVLERYFKRKLI